MIGLTASTGKAKTPAGPSLDSDSFEAIAALAYRECGLTLTAEKLPMVQSRLRRRLHDLRIEGFSAYCAYLASDEGLPERRHLISALTTNVSHFFREAHHFEHLSEHFGQALHGLRNGQSLRLWSAGCSNGQEPLSVAMTLLEKARDLGDCDVRILATDIDPAVIRFARQAQYPEGWMNGLSEARRDQFFTPLQGAKERVFEARACVRDILRFNELNLLRPWPMSRRFDVIFCRNVVIYFDQETQDALWPRFAAALRPGGFLYLGHSERIAEPRRYGFELAGPTTYRRIDQ